MKAEPRTGKKAKKYPYFGIRPSKPMEIRVREVAAALTRKRREAGYAGEITVTEVILTCLNRGLPAMESEVAAKVKNFTPSR